MKIYSYKRGILRKILIIPIALFFFVSIFLPFYYSHSYALLKSSIFDHESVYINYDSLFNSPIINPNLSVLKNTNLRCSKVCFSLSLCDTPGDEKYWFEAIQNNSYYSVNPSNFVFFDCSFFKGDELFFEKWTYSDGWVRVKSIFPLKLFFRKVKIDYYRFHNFCYKNKSLFKFKSIKEINFKPGIYRAGTLVFLWDLSPHLVYSDYLFVDGNNSVIPKLSIKNSTNYLFQEFKLKKTFNCTKNCEIPMIFLKNPYFIPFYPFGSNF